MSARTRSRAPSQSERAQEGVPPLSRRRPRHPARAAPARPVSRAAVLTVSPSAVKSRASPSPMLPTKDVPSNEQASACRPYGVLHERRRRPKRGYDDCFEVRSTLGVLASVERTPVELIDSQQYQYGGLDPEGFDEATQGARRSPRGWTGREGTRLLRHAGGIIVAFVVVHVPPLPDHGHRKTSSANRTGAVAGRRRPATAAFDVRRHQGLSKVWQM